MKKLSEYVILRKRFFTGLFAALILLFMFTMAWASSHGAFGDPGDSAIVDEIAHIPSGYTYDKDHDYRLNPEHPPLFKSIAALPLMANKDITGPEKDWSWNGVNQWEAGWYLLYQAGNDATGILNATRFPMMLIMVSLGLFLFLWAKKMFGRKTALLVLILYAFYPDVLAHGRLVTNDVMAAFGFVVATYFFGEAMQNLNRRTLIYAALAFAFAQLCKFSAILLFAIFLILLVIKAMQEANESKFWRRLRTKDFWSKLWLYFKPFFWICLISVIFVWIVYIPFTYRTPPEIEHKLIETNLTSDARTLLLRNFLHHFENNFVLRALGHYLLGLMLVVARVGGGNNTYILDHFSNKSISWYFPVAWLLKTPLPIIILVITSLIALIVKWPAEKTKKWQLTLILAPIVVYWAVTLRGNLNIGIRHLLPTVPFALLLIGFFIQPIINFGQKWKKAIILFLVVYMVGSTLYNYPSFIAYFNEFTPKDQRYKKLDDSSLDWGQDLLRLKKYVDDNNIKSIKVDYFGGGLPSYSIPEAVEWHSAYGPTDGWIAISTTFFQSSRWIGPSEGQWTYEWLNRYGPKAIIGNGSILVFYVPKEDLYRNYPTLPYPVKTVTPMESN